MNNYCTLYIARHGETEGNLKKLAQGHTNSPLTENGIQQVRALRDVLAETNFDAIFSSDLGRAQQTAGILNEERGLAIKTSELLRERAFGEYENTSDYIKDLQKALGEDVNNNVFETFSFGKGDESEEQVVARFIRQLREISVAYPGKNVLVVTHGGAMRMFLIKLGFATRKELLGAIRNAAYIKLQSDGIDFIVDEVVGITKNIIETV